MLSLYRSISLITIPVYYIPMLEENNSEEEKTSLERVRGFFWEVLGFIWDLVKTAAIVAVIAFIIRFFLVEPFIVQGSSMEPSLHNLDYLLIEKVSDNFKDGYVRGSVVVFHPPSQPRQNFIKRIVGLPNEQVFIRNNQVLIQNQENPQGFILPEEYLLADTVTEGTIEANLGPSDYYLLGDNRANSKDSRSFGPISRNQIVGKTWITIYSQTGPHLIEAPSY